MNFLPPLAITSVASLLIIIDNLRITMEPTEIDSIDIVTAIEGEPSNWNRPYTFVKSDWHIVAWIGVLNMILPSLLYYR